jgi:two-component system, chemotaxis family, protein-glutamate methylesterase/glutaminase
MAGALIERDIVVIGASAGGLEALIQLFRDLPADLPAAVFVVLHIGPAATSLASILDRAGPLRVKEAENGDRIEASRAYVAAPDRHLLMYDGHLLLRRGPHENMSPPAVDPLFRSAACNFGARVIGVVLSGALNDGTAGLHAVKRCGGLAIIQDPANAAAPGMVESALQHVKIDHIVPIAGMGALLAQLAGTTAQDSEDIPPEICLEAAIAAQERQGMSEQRKLGELAPFSCPECGGTLWEIADAAPVRYRCHVGHAYTAEATLAAQTDETEQLLNRLLRVHRERAALVRRMAAGERARQRNGFAVELEARARAYDENAAVMEELLSLRDEGRA